MSIDIRHLTTVDATSFHIHRVNLNVPGHETDAASAIRYIADAYHGEPLFVIRGRDALAFAVLGAYEAECERHGLYEMASQARAHRLRFRAWQVGNAPITKLPDPHTEWTTSEEPSSDHH